MSVPKEELYRLVEALPEQKTARAKRLLEVLLTEESEDEAWAEILANPAIDDDPLDDEELAAIEEAKKDIIAGRVTPWDQVKKDLGL